MYVFYGIHFFKFDEFWGQMDHLDILCLFYGYTAATIVNRYGGQELFKFHNLATAVLLNHSWQTRYSTREDEPTVSLTAAIKSCGWQTL